MCTLFIDHLLLLVTIIVYVAGQTCDFVPKLSVNYYEFENSTEWTYVDVSGCLSDATFAPVKIVKFSITEGVLPFIGKNFMSNMEKLKDIEIEKFQVFTIEPGAFVNLPQLERIDINGNSISVISAGVFSDIPSLKILYLWNNKIKVIEDHAFANLPNLKEISLIRNGLDYIKREWFTNTTNIEKFNMFNNAVRTVPAGMFHGWKKLIEVHFSSNAISKIEAPMFKNNAPYVIDVGLHHNRLETISLDIFPENMYIANLFISGNLLNFIPEEFLKKSRLGSVAIYGNPFNCACFHKINKIFWQREVIVDHPNTTYVEDCKGSAIPVCALAKDSPDVCVETVDKELTRSYLDSLKSIRYDTKLDGEGQQCAMFDDLN